MNDAALFLTLGGLFLAGLLADMVGRHTLVPRVTLLLACGILVGSSGFNLLPAAAQDWYDFLSVAALTMVAFLLGSALTRENLSAHGKAIVSISIGVVAVTFALVTAGLAFLGTSPTLAILLGAIATATAPAATLDVLRQTGIRNDFTEALEGVVAIDDVWGLMVFSLALAMAGMFDGLSAGTAVRIAIWEIVGAGVLGIAIGLPAAFLTGRVSAGDPLRTEALGIVFLTAGVALWLEVSFLIAGMTAGALIVNFARHHDRAFHEIEGIQWPFMVLFFILAGASFEVGQIAELGMIGLAFVCLRIIARIVGAGLGARIAGLAPVESRWFGIALMPQAGVAVGMGLIGGKMFPSVAEPLLTITIASTVVFEIFGPFATMWAVRRVVAARD